MSCEFSIIRQAESTSSAATSAAPSPQPPPPPPSEADKLVNPKIDKIANDISALNLIEVAQLSDLLKRRLNLPDAPVMPMGGFAVASQAEVIFVSLQCYKCICMYYTSSILWNIIFLQKY